MNPLPQDSEKNFLRRWKDRLFGNEEDDEYMDEYEPRPVAPTAPAATPSARQAAGLRLHMSRASRVAVRLNLQVIDDAKIAADGLKSGEHQIINLEKAKPEMAERILDFLVGACYALDGKVNRIGDRVYMFVPANVDVDTADEGTPVYRRSPYEDEQG